MRFKQSSTARKNVWAGGRPIQNDTPQKTFTKRQEKKQLHEFSLCRVVPFQVVSNQELFYHLDRPNPNESFDNMLQSILIEFLQCS